MLSLSYCSSVNNVLQFRSGGQEAPAANVQPREEMKAGRSPNMLISLLPAQNCSLHSTVQGRLLLFSRQVSTLIRSQLPSQRPQAFMLEAAVPSTRSLFGPVPFCFHPSAPIYNLLCCHMLLSWTQKISIFSVFICTKSFHSHL